MGDAQPKASADSDKPAPERARRKPSRLTLWWRFFWMLHSGARAGWALVLAIPALLAAIYLALPVRDQAVAVGEIQAAGQALGATGLRVGVEVTLVVCSLASVALLLAPGYRAYRYLHLPTSVIPEITVLVDTENIANHPKCEPLLGEILTYLRTDFLASRVRKGLRADFLYFMDVSQLERRPSDALTGNPVDWRVNLKWAYRKLYRSGFRLVNAPHRLFGKAPMAEAVDRELALFAFERALLGGIPQEFIIVSGDSDFAPLIFRLIGLGHAVQMWTWRKSDISKSDAYDAIQEAIPALVVERFPRSSEDGAASDGATETQQDAPPPTDAKPTPTLAPQPAVKAPARSNTTSSAFEFDPLTPPAVEFTQVAMNDVYYAIYNTMELSRQVRAFSTRPGEWRGKWDAALVGAMKPRGYQGKYSSASWARMLVTLGALTWDENGVPAPGQIAAEEATRTYHAMALAVARETTRTNLDKSGNVTVEALFNHLLSGDVAGPKTPALFALVGDDNKQRLLDLRYVVYAARALGLLACKISPESPALIRSPKLTPLAVRLLAQEEAGPADAAQASPADIPPEAPGPADAPYVE